LSRDTLEQIQIVPQRGVDKLERELPVLPIGLIEHERGVRFALTNLHDADRPLDIRPNHLVSSMFDLLLVQLGKAGRIRPTVQHPEIVVGPAIFFEQDSLRAIDVAQKFVGRRGRGQRTR
jgi:hypothetical protein